MAPESPQYIAISYYRRDDKQAIEELEDPFAKSLPETIKDFIQLTKSPGFRYPTRREGRSREFRRIYGYHSARVETVCVIRGEALGRLDRICRTQTMAMLRKRLLSSARRLTLLVVNLRDCSPFEL
jgi:hypothetical protein